MHIAGLIGINYQIVFLKAYKLRRNLNNSPTTSTGSLGVIDKNLGLRYNPSALLNNI